MICISDHWITGQEIDANRRNTIYVFGDNVAHRGRGGQAKICRERPNCIGIPTKWGPSNNPQDFFHNQDFYKAQPYIDSAFRQIDNHIAQGRNIIFFPGIGEGLAQLPTKAPAIHDYIQKEIRRRLTQW